ncbi:MAG: ERF family protein [Porphyromonadaceae bacterium]|nr:ERF family protein [Porphyromonadaceae bacterium]
MSAQQTELAVRQETTPAMLLNIAIEKGADLDKLEKLMELQLRWEANQARKAYTEAMTSFKSNPPDIEKDKHVNYSTKMGNKVDYHHATLANVTDKINSALSQHGLSASWVTSQNEKLITVTCRITHVLGHFEETSLSAAPDDSGGKNAIQAVGSSVSYLQRYTLLAITGLATREMDNDAQGAVEYITDEQQTVINGIVEDKKVDLAKFLAHMKVESVNQILKGDYQKAITVLKAARGQK